MENQKPSILVVEDQEIVRQLLMDYLVQRSFAVVGAATGASAMDLLQERIFDAVLLDLGLPDVDGWELLQKMHASFPTLPIILLSGRGYDQNLQRQALEKGAAVCLTKGSDMETIFQNLKDTLARKR